MGKKVCFGTFQAGFTAGLILYLTSLMYAPFLSAQTGSTGYINRTGIDLLTGNSDNSIRLQMTHGYRFKEQISAGIGSGYVFYRDPLDLIPVFLDVVYQWGEGGVTPFFQVKAGYSITILHDRSFDPDSHRGGPLLNPALGLQIRNDKGPGLYIAAGFNVDNSRMEYEGFGTRIINETISYRRISMSFGFIF